MNKKKKEKKGKKVLIIEGRKQKRMTMMPPLRFRNQEIVTDRRKNNLIFPERVYQFLVGLRISIVE